MELIKTRQIDDLALLSIEGQLAQNLVQESSAKHDFATRQVQRMAT